MINCDNKHQRDITISAAMSFDYGSFDAVNKSRTAVIFSLIKYLINIMKVKEGNKTSVYCVINGY